MVELGWFILCDLSSYSWLGQLCSVGRSDKGVEREQKYEKSLDTLIQSSYNLISGDLTLYDALEHKVEHQRGKK